MNTSEFSPVDRKEWINSSKLWGYDLSYINFVFLFVNIFFISLIISGGLILTIKYLKTLVIRGNVRALKWPSTRPFDGIINFTK